MQTKKILLLLALLGIFTLLTKAQSKISVTDVTGSDIQITGKDIVLKLYPNPAVNELNIIRTSHGEIIFNLYNITGKKVIYKELDEKNTRINVSKIPAGRYIYRIVNNNDSLLTNGMISIVK